MIRYSDTDKMRPLSLSLMRKVSISGGEPGHMRFKFTESLKVIQMVQTLHTSANILHVCIHNVVTQTTLKFHVE